MDMLHRALLKNPAEMVAASNELLASALDASRGLPPLPPLEFNEARHVYTCGGRVVPNVTSILQSERLIDLSFVAGDVLAYACERGDAVHVATELDDMDDLVEESVHDNIIGYLNGWRRFKAETGFVVEAIEKLLFDRVRWYAGKFDRLGTMYLPGGEVVHGLFDIKSGARQKATGYQTAAYHACLPRSEQHRKRFGVYLRPDGTYDLVPYTSRHDLAVFYAALTLANERRAA